eukprot:4837641-Lingulodinium_polyedra.AAC.1
MSWPALRSHGGRRKRLGARPTSRHPNNDGRFQNRARPRESLPKNATCACARFANAFIVHV